MSAPTHPSETILLAPDHVITTAIGDTLLVFDPNRRQAHLLNASAAAVWISHDGCDRQTAIAALGDAVGLGADELAADLDTLVPQLVEVGLLHPADDLPARPAAPASERTDLFPPGLELPEDLDDVRWAAVVGPYRALHVDVDIACTDPALARHLDRALRPLRTDAPARHRYRVATAPDGGPAPLADGRQFIAFDDRAGTQPASPERAASWLLWHLNQLASTTADDRLQLHASAAADAEGRIVAFPAEMNSGKSTLVAGLVQRGLRYVTDETVALDPMSGLVVPYPKPIGLDPGSWSVLPELEPELPADEARFRHEKWYVDPVRIRPDAVAGPGPLRLLVFPRYDPSGPTTLHALDTTETAMALAGCAFNLDRVGQPGLDLLGRVATEVPGYRLSVHDLDSGCRAVLDLLAELGADDEAHR